MNILRLVYEWPPPWSGLAPGPYEITAAQARAGATVRVLCGGWPRHSAESLPNVHVRRLPSALQRLSLFATTAPAALALTLAWQRWADVIHGHQHLPAWYHRLRPLTGRRSPYVLHLHIAAAARTAHAQAQGTPLDFWTRRVEWPLHAASDRLGCRVADAVICASVSVRDDAVRYYDADPARLHVVPNGVNVERFTPDGPSRRAELGLADDDRVIVAVGALSARKRPHLLVAALAQLPPAWKLVLVGSGPLAGALQEQAAQLGVADRIRLTGYVPYPALPAIYRAADVFALPAHYEGFPKVVLEAAAAGLPVVSTRSFVPDAALLPLCTLVEEDSAESLADACRAAVSRPVDVAAVRAHYAWSAKVAQIAAVYRAIGVNMP